MPSTILALLMTFPFLVACGDDPEPEPPRHRVHLLALDGADLDIIRGLVAAGRLPNFARVLTKGAAGGLLSLAPRHSPIVWTTVATGRPASEHGIDERVVTNRVTNRLRPISSIMRRTEALWDIASRGDREVRVTGWPGTWPPEPVRGILVPDRFTFETPAADRLVFPKDLARELRPLIRRPQDVKIRFVIPRGDPREAALTEALAIEETRRTIATRIGNDADLVVRWSGLLGTVSHQFMGAASPRSPHVSQAEFESYGQAVVGVYDDADDLLGRSMASLGEDGVLLVVSAYGFRHGIQRPVSTSAPDSCSAAVQHRPRGFVLAFGAGVLPGAELSGARTIDIVPTVLALLGLPGGEDLRGRYLEDAFIDPAPTRTVATFEQGRYERQLETVAGVGEERESLLDMFPELAWVGSATHLRTPLARAIIALEKGDTRLARGTLQAGIAETPELAVLHGLLGDIFDSVDKKGPAEEAYLEAIRLDPTETAWRARLARSLASTGRGKEALEVIDAAIANEPADSTLHAVRGDLLIDAGREQAGLLALARAVELEPDDITGRMRLGTALLARAGLAEAEVQFREILRLDAGTRSAWNNLGVVLLRRVESAPANSPARNRAVADAKKILNEAIRRFPDYARAWFNRATLNDSTGDRPAAIRDVKRACELDPEYEAARRLRKRLE